MKQLSAVALASGPGSYTGLRIGASTAKGLCFGLDIPLIGINSLEALIQGVDAELGEDDLVIASIDARRAEVYAMIFDSNLKVLQPTTSIILDEPNIISINYPNHKLHCIGNGAQKCKDLLPQKVVVYSEQSSSKFLCKLAFGKWQSAEFNDIITFSPSYYKNPNITLTKKKPL